MTTPAPIYIAVEGVIGVGKTTLATLLQPDYDAALLLEVFEDNPFLARFYEEPERYAFPAQVAFLLSRFEQQRVVPALTLQGSLISDYLFAKDRLFARLNLQGAEWDTYRRLHSALAEQIVQPDLVIFLRAEVDTLMARIARRGRPYERNMERDYIARLADAYDHFFATFPDAPVLCLDTDDLNVVDQIADLARVRSLVQAALRDARAARASCAA